MEENRSKGKVFENMIVAECQKNNHHRYLQEDYYFWQDSNGHEVDLLTKKGEGFSIFEIKSTQTVSPALFKELDWFEAISSPAKIQKRLIYGGSENERRTHYFVNSWRDPSATK